MKSPKTSNASNDNFSESENEKEKEKEEIQKNDDNIKDYIIENSSLKQIQQTLDENIFAEMKLRIKQVSLVERINILPEKRESGLLNKKEMNEIDKGFKIIKNTETIKEYQSLIKICDLLKFLCLFYVKIGSFLETPNLKSFLSSFLLEF